MEARQIRRRHYFHSSVGSMLNENYISALTPTSAKTAQSPLPRNQCSSIDSSIKYIDNPVHKLPSDLYGENDNAHFDPDVLTHQSNTVEESLSDRYTRSQSAMSVTSSGSCLSLPRKLDANRSTASSQLTTSGPLTWPEINGQGSRQSTPSGCSETDTYRPFSSTTNDFIGGKFRFSPVVTPQSVEYIAKIEPPKYYDAYREIMESKPKSQSSVCSVYQGDANIETLAEIKFPCDPRVPHSVPNVYKRATSSHSTGSAHHTSSNRSVTPALSSPHQQKCVTFCDRRKSRSRSSSAVSMSSMWNEQKPAVFYTGRTPSRTPSPDYKLPVFPSQAWIQHYSPTYIRHFMRAANDAVKNTQL